MSRKPRILFVVNDPAFFLSHRLPLAEAARSKGYEVHVATPEEAGAEVIRAAGFAFHPIPLRRLSRNPWHEFVALIGLYSLFRRLKPDLVHLVTIKPVIYGGLMARLTGIPAVVCAISGLGYVFISRGMKARLTRVFIKGIYRLALGHSNSRSIFQNPDDKELFFRSRLVAPDRSALIRGSGVDLNKFRPFSELFQPPVVLLASRMLWDKGVGEFVEAARILKKRGVVARFWLAGDMALGNPAAVPKEVLESWLAEGMVEWLGYQSDMPSIFSACHIVCLPSYREGLPKVLLEAAACGRPIVATDVPGCREIVHHGENGLLVPVRDALSLALALQRLIENAYERGHMGAVGRLLVEKEFSLGAVIEQTLNVYQDLLTPHLFKKPGPPCT